MCEKDNWREEFEQLPSIRVFLPSFKFNVDRNEYERSESFNQPEYTLGFFNGAWYAFQHERAKVEELQEKCDGLLELVKYDTKAQAEMLDKIDELKKRVDKALQEIKGAARWIDEDASGDSDWLKGGALHALKRLEQALKGEAE